MTAIDKIQKLLSKIPKKDRQRIIETIELILSRRWGALDVKKLSGFNEWRARVGDFRIKFYMQKDGKVTI